MKRIKLHFFTVLTMTLLALSATAYNFEVNGIYYNINGTEATVTYKKYSNYNYTSDYSGSVIIPATVTYAGTTYSVTAIGDFAFCECPGLTSVTIPNSVTTIDDWAFSRCSGLTSVTIPNSVTTIGQRAFISCSGLTSITIPNSVTFIGSSAFSCCSGLISISVENGNPNYDSRNSCNAIIETATNMLIAGCMNTTIPNSVTTIGNEAFSGCSGLTSITIPNSVTTISEGGFYGCSGLTSITIPNSINTIANYVFRGCSGLTSITIPNSVTYIGDEAFYGTAWYNNQPGGLIYAGRVAYEYKGTVPSGTNITIKEGTVSISPYAFSSCSGLTSVTIPSSVTTIGYHAFNAGMELTSVTCLAIVPPTIYLSNVYDDDLAFLSNVTSQATLYVPRESIAAYQAAYNWQDFSQIVGIPVINDFEVDGIWYWAFDDNTAMVIQRPDEDDLYSGDIVIPEDVTYEGYTFTVTAIDEGAFEDCYDLSSVVIGDAVENIGENAFQGCTGLTSVTIGSGVTNIGAKAFNYCNALQTVTCRGTVPPEMASSNCFSNAAYSRAVLKVPRPVIETYAATDYWYKFSHIEGWGYLGPGDVNGSGTIDMDDLTCLINIMLTDDLGGIDPSWADVTGNGIVSMNDLTELINILLDQ